MNSASELELATNHGHSRGRPYPDLEQDTRILALEYETCARYVSIPKEKERLQMLGRHILSIADLIGGIGKK